MKKIKIGDLVYIQSFKHDGSLHRTWSRALVLDILEDCYVVVTDQSFVIESDGRKWVTKEPAVCFFYFNHWYNVISMARKNGIYYYCNIASPSLLDEDIIKNIDYDLDLKVYPDYQYNILDEHEYRNHSKKMSYPKEIMQIVEDELTNLIRKVENREDPFNYDLIDQYLIKYFQLISK